MDAALGPAVAPSIVLAAGGLLCLLLEVAPPAARRLAAGVATATIVLAAAALYALRGAAGEELASDVLVLALAPASFIAALAAIVLGEPWLRRSGRWRAEYHALVLFSTAGMVLLAQARDFVMLFVALETLSIPLYVLTGFVTDKARPLEAALKYFTTGAFASAFVAFGSALAYGATGSVTFSGTAAALQAAAQAGEPGRLLLAEAGLAFLLVGLGFKVALAPFHAWAPDVYQGSPTPVMAFLSVGSKVAGFAGLVRIVVDVFAPLPGAAGALAGLAAVTLVVGNCVAMLQDDVKRLIAYSGISHAGFVLMGLAAHARLAGGGATPFAGSGAPSSASAAVLFYLVAYALMTTGAVTVIAIVERATGEDVLLTNLAGLSSRRPLLAACMLVFMLSLGGMPPLAGFFGKWLVFQASVEAGLIWLAVVAAVTSVMGFYYYLRVVLQMYLAPAPPRADEPAAHRAPWLLVGGTALATVVLGLAPGILLRFLMEPAALALLSQR